MLQMSRTHTSTASTCTIENTKRFCVTEVLTLLSRTAQRWHIVMESPMASGPDPPIPDLSESHVAKTVMTSTKEMIASTPKVIPSVTPGLGCGVHTTSFVVFVTIVSPSRIPAPAIAPTDCTTMYRNALLTTLLLFIIIHIRLKHFDKTQSNNDKV